MKQYEVSIIRQTTEHVIVEVGANDEKAAADKANAILHTMEIIPFDVVATMTEITKVEEVSDD